MRLQSQRWGSTFVQMKGGQEEIGNSLAKFCWGGFEGLNRNNHVLKRILGFFFGARQGKLKLFILWSSLTFAHGNPAVTNMTGHIKGADFTGASAPCGCAIHKSWCVVVHVHPWNHWSYLEVNFMEVKSWGTCSTDQGIMQCFDVWCILNNQYFMECQVCFPGLPWCFFPRPESFWRSTLPNDTLLRRHSILNPDGGGDPKTDPTVDQFVELHKFFGKSGLFQYVFTDEVYRENLTYDRLQDFEREHFSFKSCFGTISWYWPFAWVQASGARRKVRLESLWNQLTLRGMDEAPKDWPFNPAGTFGKKWGHRNTFWYCWWFRNPARKPVGVGRLFHYLQVLKNISGGCLGFLKSTVCCWHVKWTRLFLHCSSLPPIVFFRNSPMLWGVG